MKRKKKEQFKDSIDIGKQERELWKNIHEKKKRKKSKRNYDGKNLQMDIKKKED